MPTRGNMKQVARAMSSWIWSSEMAVAASLCCSWSSSSNGGSPGAGNPLSSCRMAWAERYQSLYIVHISTLFGEIVGEGGPYQGNRTDQLRNIAAKTSIVTSVTNELPSWKKMPAIAGSRARPSGAECQCDSSVESVPWPFSTRGRNKSSVDERIELRASESVSERVEFCR